MPEPRITYFFKDLSKEIIIRNSKKVAYWFKVNPANHNPKPQAQKSKTLHALTTLILGSDVEAPRPSKMPLKQQNTSNYSRTTTIFSDKYKIVSSMHSFIN